VKTQVIVIIGADRAALVISRRARHMYVPLPPEHEHALVFTHVDELLALPFLGPEAVRDSMAAYEIAKKANHLRVHAARWPVGSAMPMRQPACRY
jgi:hypothetical protein